MYPSVSDEEKKKTKMKIKLMSSWVLSIRFCARVSMSVCLCVCYVHKSTIILISKSHFAWYNVQKSVCEIWNIEVLCLLKVRYQRVRSILFKIVGLFILIFFLPCMHVLLLLYAKKKKKMNGTHGLSDSHIGYDLSKISI